MWTVASLINGTWTAVPAFELNQAPTTEAVRGLAAEVLPEGQRHLIRHLDAEMAIIDTPGGGSGRRDAIQLWNTAAESEAREFSWAGTGKIEALEEALALYPEGTDYGDTEAVPDTLAWHDETAVIISLSENAQQIFLEYTPSLRDENRVDRLRHRYATPEHQLETVLDWRGYFGRESAIVDGWTMMRQHGYDFMSSVVGTFGFVVAHVVRRLTKPQRTFKNDPTAHRRLIQMTESYPQVAASYPDLARAASSQWDAATVFVHGTVSCGIQGLKDLVGFTPDQPIFRYEHDTFHAVRENGSELAELISTKLSVNRLLLAAHSRGGLVARFAADELARKAYRADIQVFTFGTPHQGTPLAAMGGQFLNLLYKLGGIVLKAIPITSLLGKAYSFLISCPTLPPGIQIMREDSEELVLLNTYGDGNRVSSWGGYFPIHTGNSGFGILTTGALLGALSGIGHDLVVPTHSALGFGRPQPVLQCSHTQYFEHPEVQAAIRNFYPAPVAVPAAAGTAPSPATGSVIRDASGALIINGIKVPVNMIGGVVV